MALIKIRQILLWLDIGLATGLILLAVVIAINLKSIHRDSQLTVTSFGKPPISLNNKQLIQVILSFVKNENQGSRSQLIWILTNRPLPADEHLVAWSFPNRENNTIRVGGVVSL